MEPLSLAGLSRQGSPTWFSLNDEPEPDIRVILPYGDVSRPTSPLSKSLFHPLLGSPHENHYHWQAGVHQDHP
jgi:hypothetical protein